MSYCANFSFFVALFTIHMLQCGLCLFTKKIKFRIYVCLCIEKDDHRAIFINIKHNIISTSEHVDIKRGFLLLMLFLFVTRLKARSKRML